MASAAGLHWGRSQNHRDRRFRTPWLQGEMVNFGNQEAAAKRPQSQMSLVAPNPRPFRVLVAGLRGIPDVEGGIESHARHLYPAVAELGWKVEIAVRRPFHPRGKSNTWGSIALLPLWSPSTRGLEALVHTLLATLHAIRSRPDIYHVHAIGPALVAPLARLFGIKVVVTHHGPDYDREKWGRLSRFVLRLGERMGMRFANARIVISQTIRDLVREKYDVECAVIPNGVHRPEATPSTGVLKSLGLTPGRYVLQVSRFVPEKRQRDLVDAFTRARIDGWQLVLVGGLCSRDSYTQEIQALAAENEHIVLPGFRSGEELSQIFQNAGAFVLPSSHEGLPIALLEALSHGLHAIASDIPANLEVGLPSECYFPLGDVEALAGRLRDLARQAGTLAEASERRDWVLSRYDWQTIARETVDVYTTALIASEQPPKEIPEAAPPSAASQDTAYRVLP